MTTAREGRPWLAATAAAIALYVALLVIGQFLGPWIVGKNLGQAGDYLGGTANIVAMAGVVLALVMQRHELSLQREELSLTRQELEAQRLELAKQVDALNAQLSAAREATRAHHFITLHQFFLSPEFRHARGVLIKLHGEPLSKWGDGARQEAEKACASWNYVALLVKEGIIPREVIADATYSITKCHEAARELLAEVRRERDPNHWRYFSDLAASLSKPRGA